MRCTLCPRNCGAERTNDEGPGRCAMPALPVVARAALHYWEEPPISGSRGSGTVFFSGCPLKCVFCQNEAISRRNFGKVIPVSRLREIFLELISQGAHNINLVNPTHFSQAISQALKESLPVPVVWNSGGYDKVETLRSLEGKVQVYLPDLKYLDAGDASRYSGAADYPETAKSAIREMVRQTGPYALDSGGLMARGVLIRHLILPGRVRQAKAVMDWVAETFPPGTVLFSLMSQYLPWGRAVDFPEINRTLRASEIRSAEEYMGNLGLEGFTQAGEAAEEGFIPSFDLTGVE
ncbi:hypothetical protein SDC9_64277 [bioreactor metagenome]|uniref:Radical SAM core domain-containing protein n=1 Tax=bioreactor metagenome TaxID=1076179 RepID=A0A644XPH2_9ZZZZ